MSSTDVQEQLYALLKPPFPEKLKPLLGVLNKIAQATVSQSQHALLAHLLTATRWHATTSQGLIRTATCFTSKRRNCAMH